MGREEESLMTMLTKGIYGTALQPLDGPFGLRRGQRRVERFYHNAGWFNRTGEKLGWGDLSPDDIRKIMSELPEDEIFIIIAENSTPRDDVIDRQYVIKNASYIISPNRLVAVRQYLPPGSSVEVNILGLAANMVDPTEARRLILGN